MCNPFRDRVESLKKTIMDDPALRRSFFALGFTHYYRSILQQLIEQEKRKHYEELINMNEHETSNEIVTSAIGDGTATTFTAPPKYEPYTPLVMAELTRCRKAIKAYIESVHEEGHSSFHNERHSAAVRATLDLSKCLAKWRKISSSGRPDGHLK